MKVGIPPREIKNHEYRVAISQQASTNWSAEGTRSSSKRVQASAPRSVTRISRPRARRSSDLPIRSGRTQIYS